MKTWRTPQIHSLTFEEMAKKIQVKATSINPPGSCKVGGCSCSTQCDPLALYWSCYDFWIGIGD